MKKRIPKIRKRDGRIVEFKDDLKLSLNAVEVLKRRYLLKDELGRVIETPGQMFERVAKAIARAELNYGKSKEEVKELEPSFHRLMRNLEFLPNSPTLMNAGTELGQLAACFVLPVADSMESIFTAVKNTALIHQSGGGTGFSFSRLRPKGDMVKSTGGVASGPVSFMRVFDVATEVIKQGGKRRGANMGILSADHPDILEFIRAKEGGEFTNFNTSVAVTDDFMHAVERNEEYGLINPRTKKEVRNIRARDVFNEIVTYAWKTGDPGIIFIDEINSHNPVSAVGRIEATNPCITGSTLISTRHGLIRMEEIAKKYSEGGIKIATDNRVLIKISDKDGNIYLMQMNRGGINFNSISEAFCSGSKEVYRLRTKSGYELEATGDHKVLTNEGWIELIELDPAKHRVLIQSCEGEFGENYGLPVEVNKLNLPEKWSKELGQVLGWLIGDGWLRAGDENCRVGFSFSEEDKEELGHLKGIINSWYGYGIKEIRRENGIYHLSYHSKYFVDFFMRLGVRPVKAKEKEVPESIFNAPREAVVGFLQGLFSADGTIRDSRKSNSDWLALSSKSLKLLKETQILLINLGIKSRIFNRSRPERKDLFEYITKEGEARTYGSDGVLYELGIFGRNLDEFGKEVGFISGDKTNRLNNIRPKKRRKVNFTDKIESITKVGKRRVYDLTEPITHSMICQGIVVHQCGEQPLLPYESCNLGSINVSKFIENGEIDCERLREAVWLCTRFLDDVIDVNRYPLPEIEKMTKTNRKIGLGIMGFAELLIQLGIAYDSKDALSMGEKLMRFITNEARRCSTELGLEKGSFPNFELSVWSAYEAMRNATVTTIAPAGTIGIIGNCSSGIEPLFAVAFVRNVMGGMLEINKLFEEIAKESGFYSKDLITEVAKCGSVQAIDGIPADVKRVFVTALDIAPEWHVRMQAAFQKYTDNATSKTVNLRSDATWEDVKTVFLLAYKLKCKGITVYRYGSKKQVLSLEVPKLMLEEYVCADSEYTGECRICSV